MSKIGVSLKIDVTKIDKARLHAGKKGTYLDATVFIDLNKLDEYGQSGMIAQSVSKEEREKNIQGNILGNSTIFYADGIDMPVAMGISSEEAQFAPNQAPAGVDNFDDSIPF